jgi:hypothetical protein
MAEVSCIQGSFAQAEVIQGLSLIRHREGVTAQAIAGADPPRSARELSSVAYEGWRSCSLGCQQRCSALVKAFSINVVPAQAFVSRHGGLSTWPVVGVMGALTYAGID